MADSSPLVAPGRKAPAFRAPDQSGTVRSLAQCKGRTVVLYFYPKDDTSGCTVEACSFRDGWAKFRKAGIEVFGVSPDGTTSHAKFAKKFSLPFPLLADEPAAGKAPTICSAYGTWQEKSMYGKKYMGVARTTFVIGADGKVAARFDKVKPDGHADEILAAIAALPSAQCTKPKSASSASAKAPSSPRTKASTRRASTSTRASKRR
jgi:thioredoxin-dependent peroxiredoxin